MILSGESGLFDGIFYILFPLLKNSGKAVKIWLPTTGLHPASNKGITTGTLLLLGLCSASSRPLFGLKLRDNNEDNTALRPGLLGESFQIY